MIGVDTDGEGGEISLTVVLQWGHAVIGVDTGEALELVLLAALASMGPRRDWRGYRHSHPRDRGGSGQLQWGHAVIGVDTGTYYTNQTNLKRFNGATP